MMNMIEVMSWFNRLRSGNIMIEFMLLNAFLYCVLFIFYEIRKSSFLEKKSRHFLKKKSAKLMPFFEKKAKILKKKNPQNFCEVCSSTKKT
jgi:hypothetical protein